MYRFRKWKLLKQKQIFLVDRQFLLYLCTVIKLKMKILQWYFKFLIEITISKNE